MNDNIIILDIRVNGYKGSATRLIAICDTTSGSLYISSEKKYRTKDEQPTTEEDKKKAEKTLIVTDAPSVIQNWNLAFDEKINLAEAVDAYRHKTNNNLLKMHDSVAGRFDLKSVLESRKLDMGGQVWELHTDTENGQMCTLLACWAATRAGSTKNVTTQVDDIFDDGLEDDDYMNMPFSL